jgi:serine/threonine protein kinase
MTLRLLLIIATVMTRVRVNRIERQIRDGAVVFVKKRRFGGSVVIWFGNWFLALANSGIFMFVQTRDWLAWEDHCARLLYPYRVAVKFELGNKVIVPEVRGVSLRQLVNSDEKHLKSFVAAARELRRVHQIHCDDYSAAWSHGDLHLDNILYDSGTDQVTLIDFDTRHQRRLSETQRHADDLKTVLLELLAMPDDQWSEPATSFLSGYGDAEVLNELNRQLVMPHGFARILWYTRTSCSPIRKAEQRLRQLQRIVHQVAAADRKALHSNISHDISAKEPQ